MLREVHGFISQCPPSPLLRAWLTYHVYLTKHILVSLNAFEKILSSFHGLFPEAWRSKFNRGNLTEFSGQFAAAIFPKDLHGVAKNHGIPFPYSPACGKDSHLTRLVTNQKASLYDRHGTL
jgi:hypothetical protein